MKIIVEGLDRCGKTTLINNIVKHFKKPFTKLHYYGPPFKDDKKNIEFDVSLYKDMAKIFNYFDYVIADRSHLGALVYSPLYRGCSGEHVSEIEDDLPEDVILITLIDKAENLINRDDGESFSTEVYKKRKEIKLFVEAHDKSKIKHKLLIDIEFLNIEEVKDIAIKFLEMRINDDKIRKIKR